MLLIRLRFLGIATLVILAGLVLRLVPWGLPVTVHHVGGGLLWGAMLYCLAAAAHPSGWSRAAAFAAATVLATAVEAVRLYHHPALDAFRETLAGQLLLGRLFSTWNVLSYASGIGAAALATRRLSWTTRRDLDGAIRKAA